MASPAVDWSNALYDTIPSYRLQESIVNDFLKDLFGDWNFYTQVQMGIPRCKDIYLLVIATYCGHFSLLGSEKID
jgi:hypothetical protein